ncbi:hypothetical protein OCF64_12990 [Bacillus wiedmannii]|nr:hypothetical protein [Bacillus wiedmannii]MCU5682775.1 hypothetical protein [Bacillus wiedmannii]
MSQTQELVNALAPILVMAGGVAFVSTCISKGVPYLINSIRNLF